MERLPKLDARLLTIASMVREGARCADIGCDHGYLVAWLAAQKKISAGCACDINRKPLEKAATTTPVFSSVQLINIIEGTLADTDLEIKVDAKAIQSDDIGASSPEEVLKMIDNANK